MKRKKKTRIFIGFQIVVRYIVNMLVENHDCGYFNSEIHNLNYKF